MKKGKHTNVIKKEIIDQIQEYAKEKLDRQKYHQLKIWQLEIALLQIKLQSMIGKKIVCMGPFVTND